MHSDKPHGLVDPHGVVNPHGVRLRLPLLAAVAVIVGLGLLRAVAGSNCSEGEVAVPCPTDPVGPDGRSVADTFTFVHRPLAENGSITARLVEMTGVITYPPPDHNEIVAGLVPWAKAGVIVKAGVAQGSSYAALALTGDHGVRMQHDYDHDVAGAPGGASPGAPRWLRLTRAGDTLTGAESTDGTHWTTVGTARLPGLPATVEVGLFTTSPGDMTLTPVALGANLPAVRFTQASATFDTVTVEGAPPAPWRTDLVGRTGETDWERLHRPPGLVESGGRVTVTGSGDVGPVPEGGTTVAATLVGLAVGLAVVIVAAVRSGAAGRRAVVARALLTGAAASLAGLVAAGTVVPVGTALLRAAGTSVLAVPTPTVLRLVAGVAVLVGATAALASALGALFRRTGAAIATALAVTVLPYLLGALPLLPDEMATWLLAVTPAAGFGVLQTGREYAQVVAHYVPSAGYFPLPGWAGIAVLCGYTAAALAAAVLYDRRRTVAPFG